MHTFGAIRALSSSATPGLSFSTRRLATSPSLLSSFHRPKPSLVLPYTAGDTRQGCHVRAMAASAGAGSAPTSPAPKSTRIDPLPDSSKRRSNPSSAPSSSPHPSLVGSFLDFLNESWTQFHATAAAKEMLLKAGFQQLHEGEDWEVEAGGKYFLTRNMSTIIAFAVGGKFKVGEGVRVVAAHTDSPCLKLKPVSAINKHGYLCVGVQPYGGGLWYTWFDRDLSVAGRVIHYTNGGEGEEGPKSVGEEGNKSVDVSVETGKGSESGSEGRDVSKVGGSEGSPLEAGVGGGSGSESGGGAGKRSTNRRGPVLKHSLVKIEEPILRIPTLAIHLDRGVTTEGFKPNIETQVVPVLATSITAQLWNTPAPSPSPAPSVSPSPTSTQPPSTSPSASQPSERGGAPGGGNAQGGGKQEGAGQTNGAARANLFVPVASASCSQESEHHPALLQLLAQELGLKSPSQIVDFELNVCDTQPSCLGGAFGEFIFSGRLDNLACSYIALESLVQSCSSLDDETGVRCIALFDNEEVGSESAVGAASPSLYNTLSRVLTSLAYTANPTAPQHQLQSAVQRSFKKSFLVSADMAHGLHPNFPERHEERHQPRLHQGFVVKHNANQRYATNLVSSLLFKQLAARHSIPCQSFVVRNDMGCGSTVGPILASALGIRTVDVGLPQLSMHSIREMCAADDIDHGFKHLLAFFSSDFQEYDQELEVDN